MITHQLSPVFHLCLRLSWYFGVFCVMGLISAIWAAGVTDKNAIVGLPAGEVEECGKMNVFLRFSAYVSIAEMGVCFLLTVGLPNLMRSANWAFFGLTSMALLMLVYAAKLGILVMGMVFVWGLTDYACSAITPTLYSHSSTFLTAQIVLFAMQLILGTAFLMCFGLEDAVSESVHIFQRRYGNKEADFEEVGLMDNNNEEIRSV